MSVHRNNHRYTVTTVVVSALFLAGSGTASAVVPAAPGRPAAPTVTGPPSVVPSVRAFKAASGPGWRPGPGSRVVTDGKSPGLADEGELLARELGLAYGKTAAAGPGDIRLALSGASGPAESYGITVRDGRVDVTGPDEAGVFYGTRTVKQAVRTTGALAEGTVTDGPAKPQRGLNLDIARKYFTPGWIEARLREMADLKLNQLVLHFSDDQGFGIEIKNPRYAKSVSTARLSQAQLAGIVKLAESLHITVVPEIDSPGHLGAVLKSFPDLRLKDVDGRIVQGAIDISQAGAGPVVDALYKEFLPLFPGGAWHLGGDEYQALTRRNPEASFPGLAAAAHRLYGPGGTVKDLATRWLDDRARALAPSKKRLKAWNDGFYTGGIAKADAAIEAEYWTGKEIGARLPEGYLAEGRKVVNLNDAYLYYVLGQPNDFTYPTGRAIYEEWTPAVLRGSRPVPDAARYQDSILGGRLAVWGDRAGAQTEAQVASGIKMPLAALSEKVWNAGQPTRSWSGFQELVGRADPGAGPARAGATSPAGGASASGGRH
ncbi:beta-N-acetylhexosaminidase [Streptomyces sp. NPDC055897]